MHGERSSSKIPFTDISIIGETRRDWSLCRLLHRKFYDWLVATYCMSQKTKDMFALPPSFFVPFTMLTIFSGLWVIILSKMTWWNRNCLAIRGTRVHPRLLMGLIWIIYSVLCLFMSMYVSFYFLVTSCYILSFIIYIF